MNILVQNPFMHSGGAENRIRALIDALAHRDDIDTIHFMFSGLEPAHQIEAEGKVHFWQVRKSRVLKMTKQIIKDYDIDVVQFHNNQVVGTDGLEYAQSIGIPTIWVMHDFWPLCAQRFMTNVWLADHEVLCYDVDESKCLTCVGEYSLLLTKEQRKVIANCDIGIVPSNRIKEIFERNNLLNGKLRIVEPWINFGIFQPDPTTRKNPWQVLFVGNFIPHKGINVLLKAWEIVQKRLPMARLIAIGDDRSAGTTVDLAKKLELQGVSFLKRVEQEKLKIIYNESAVTIFPSIWEETIGLIWIESLACGTPVIASATGSIPELMKEGGITFEPRNHVELAEKLLDLLLSPSKINVLAQKGFKYVTTNFSPNRAALDFSMMYYELEAKRYANNKETTEE